MYKILNKRQLSGAVTRFEIDAPLAVRNAKPGQFVVLRTHEFGERIPLTIAEKTDKTLTVVVQLMGASTRVLCAMEPGQELSDVLGPLGCPSEIENFGTVACVGGGVGIAVIYPVVKALKQAGNRIITILGARNEKLLLYRNELKALSHEFYITTDDGSAGRKGFVSDQLADLLKKGEKISRVIEAGPVPMMLVVAEATRPFKVKTVASLNALMLDATGMCGICRVSVGGKTKFTCVDGPDFDAHEVDFKELSTRLAAYKDEEKLALEKCAKCR